MAERCGSRAAHDWRGYEAAVANRHCYDRGPGLPLIDVISDKTGRVRFRAKTGFSEAAGSHT